MGRNTFMRREHGIAHHGMWKRLGSEGNVIK
jgi:hypothetical protein